MVGRPGEDRSRYPSTHPLQVLFRPHPDPERGRHFASIMSQQNSMTASAQAVVPRKRLRAVVFGGGIGMFPPLLQRLKEEFEIVATLSPQESRWLGTWYKLRSVRWPRHAWYRKWRYYMEKTGQAFAAQTRDAGAMLEPLRDQYDVIVFFGAMFAPGTKIDKPMFLFTDSCRWLSSRTAHDSISHFGSARQEAEWLALEGQLYRRALRVFVGSDFVRNALIERYRVAPERAVTSGFGAGIGFGDPYEKQFDGRTILYIGKGDFEKKGGTLLMKAFEAVRRAVPQAQLHIVGQDKLPEAEGVVNHGFVRDRNKLVGLMRAAHVFALPSLVDRNPISILEAMASATPCVASDYGAMPEMVGDAGLIAPCNDVDALAAALIRILQDTDYARRLGERGHQRFEDMFNWDGVWKIIEREIRTALQ
jgi:glycosyltransferase involved in cell wall biosynthesis